MDINIDGLFKAAAAAETLRSAAFSGTANEYQLVFPNGDVYQAASVLEITRAAAAMMVWKVFQPRLPALVPVILRPPEFIERSCPCPVGPLAFHRHRY
jgi:hypothetical protein